MLRDIIERDGVVTGVRAEIPDDAFTAPILGTERAGNGVRFLRIPLEADYGGELFEVPDET